MSTDKSSAAIREIAEKWGWFVKAISIDMTRFELNKDTEQCLSDLTALISEHYVSREAYNVIKEHYQSALAAKDIDRDYINKYYYPKEFVEWLLKNDFRKSGGKSNYCSLFRSIHFDTLDELFNYWKENVR